MALSGFDIDPCTLALPGAGTLEYVPLDELDISSVQSVVLQSAYNQQADIGATWYTLPYAQGSGAFVEDQNDDAQAVTYKVTVSAFLPGDSAAMRGELNRMRNRRFIVRLTRTGQVLIIGMPEYPLKFESTFNSGNDGGDNRGHRVSFSGISPIKSPGYIPVF